jgi:biopolymer transport protein ExbB
MSRLSGFLSALLVSAALAAPPVWAQPSTADAAVSAPAVKESMTFVEVFRAGGWLMYPIAAMSVIGLALILYFLVVLRPDQVVPRAWLVRVRERLAGGRLDEVRALCDEKPSPVAAITAAALDYSKSSRSSEPALLKEIIEGEGIRQANLIQNQIQYLLDIAVIAPMIGLLGTVMGMLQAFNTVALDLAKAKPMLLAAGVSLALITTAAGLIVAIPAMIAYSYFRNRASNLIARLESASADLLTLLVR